MLRICLLGCALLCALLAPSAQAADRTQTKRILRTEMAEAGAYSGAHVVDLLTGRTLYTEDASTPRIPASVEKLYTTAAALQEFGPQGTIPTDVLGSAAVDPATGVLAGNLYVRGNGDPTFNAQAAGLLADILIERTGLTEVDGRVIGDETVFDGLRGPPSEGFRTSVWVGPLSALTFNRGFTGRRRPLFQAQPPLFAAKAFTAALRRRGVTVRRSARTGVTPSTAVALAGLNSPGIENIVASMNVPSDNFIAETLIKALGARFGDGGSTSAGAAVVRADAARLGIRTTVADGSGLSRSNRTSPKAVVALLTAMDEGDLALPFEASLPVAGRTGTLYDRMRGTAARDACRAKTGTLSNVSALAGYCDTRSGGRVAFAFLMNYVSTWTARRLQDRMTAALARYDG
ncbi:MAG TPA: D-alanyl-D-alanine carboxypeptidase/D-alanyl-D-alanine-endopeptidase [Solirubrobacteraceae bacterium]|nr:D-alanyl-D-alanine carboxypeptidase/D-alanyl-D-alanine-endopeptidase [Solirubrobacteraceae bacterium]